MTKKPRRVVLGEGVMFEWAEEPDGSLLVRMCRVKFGKRGIPLHEKIRLVAEIIQERTR